MKIKNNLDKKNKSFIGTVSIISLLTFFGIIYLNEYLYGIAFLLLFTFLLILYIDTSYEITDDYFIVKYSFIKIKYNFEKITSVEVVDDKVMIKIGMLDFVINSKESQKIKKNLMKKVSKK